MHQLEKNHGKYTQLGKSKPTMQIIYIFCLILTLRFQYDTSCSRSSQVKFPKPNSEPCLSKPSPASTTRARARLPGPVQDPPSPHQLHRGCLRAPPAGAPALRLQGFRSKFQTLTPKTEHCRAHYGNLIARLYHPPSCLFCPPPHCL
jgi:hypothetical protein